MADEPISSLTLYAAFHSADEVEILDMTDTTFASSGTNKRIQFSSLLAMAGVGTVASGGTGRTSLGSASQLLGVNTGATALEYKTLTAGSNITITPGVGSITIAASGGGSASQNESASTFMGNPTGSPAVPSEISLYPNLGFVGSSLRGSVPIWAATGPGTALVNSSALTSILTGAPSIGSLTIPANTLQIGNRLRFALFGAYSVTTTSSPTLTVKLLLGGTVIAQGTSSAAGSNQSNLPWMFYDTILGHYVQATGSSGKIIGLSTINVPNFFCLGLNNSGSGTGSPSQATINTTTSLAIDVQMQWSVASASDSIQLLGGAIYLD